MGIKVEFLPAEEFCGLKTFVLHMTKSKLEIWSLVTSENILFSFN